MSARSAPTTTATAVGAHIEALNLAGVAFAARRLLGKDPAAVTGQFAMWARSGSAGLPSLTAPLWKALAPLHIGAPASTNAAVCDMVLVGREPDAAVARQASADGAAEGKTMFSRAPMPADVPEADQLVTAVKAYWRVLATAYDEVRAQVIRGDQDAAIAAMRSHAPKLRTLIKTCTALSRALAELSGAEAGGGAAVVPPDPHDVVVTTGQLSEVPQAEVAHAGTTESAEAASAVEDATEVTHDVAQTIDQTAQMDAVAATPAGPVDGLGPQATPVVSGIAPVASGSLKLSDERAEAFARREALTDPGAAVAGHDVEGPTRQVEVLRDKPVRNHPFLPILFLVAVSGVALYVLFSILNDPANPLLQ